MSPEKVIRRLYICKQLRKSLLIRSSKSSGSSLCASALREILANIKIKSWVSVRRAIRPPRTTRGSFHKSAASSPDIISDILTGRRVCELLYLYKKCLQTTVRCRCALWVTVSHRGHLLEKTHFGAQPAAEWGGGAVLIMNCLILALKPPPRPAGPHHQE
jgi:hypothetical protein